MQRPLLDEEIAVLRKKYSLRKTDDFFILTRKGREYVYTKTMAISLKDVIFTKDELSFWDKHPQFDIFDVHNAFSKAQMNGLSTDEENIFKFI